MTDLHEQRRAVELLLGSKRECSPVLSRKGIALIRAQEKLVEALELIRDEAGTLMELPSERGRRVAVRDHAWCAGVAMSALASAEEERA